MRKSLNQLANEHGKWAADFFQWVYEQAFMHGYKHGYDDGLAQKPPAPQIIDQEDMKRMNCPFPPEPEDDLLHERRQRVHDVDQHDTETADGHREVSDSG